MFEFLSLPEEMQVAVLEDCEDSTLAVLCRTSRLVYEKALPVLWGHIDFEDEDDPVGPQWTFLKICDTLSLEDTGRWSKLSPLVNTLKFRKMGGPMIPHKLEGFPLVDNEFTSGPGRNVYDILAHFANLERVSLFVKESDGFNRVYTPGECAKALESGIPNLKQLSIGGQVTPDVLTSLCFRAEQMRELSLINLIETPGQDNGPNPVLFLEPIAHRFSSLTYLHLSKLGQLHEDYELAGLRWEWDAEAECSLLREWAGLLDHVSETVNTLRLENRYHTPSIPDIQLQTMRASDGEKDAVLRQYGIPSSDRCKDILFPVIARHKWPALQHVTLMGIYVEDDRGHTDPFQDMDPRPSVENLVGSFVSVIDDATPMMLSPPSDYFGE